MRFDPFDLLEMPPSQDNLEDHFTEGGRGRWSSDRGRFYWSLRLKSSEIMQMNNYITSDYNIHI